MSKFMYSVLVQNPNYSPSCVGYTFFLSAVLSVSLSFSMIDAGLQWGLRTEAKTVYCPAAPGVCKGSRQYTVLQSHREDCIKTVYCLAAAKRLIVNHRIIRATGC